MQGRSILIVDDDPNFRKTLTDILTSKGYAPAAAATGTAALDQINREKPAVALIDLRLEDMPGLELMQHIKIHSPGIECIVLTGYASQASAIKAVNLGAYGYLQKPYDMEQLLVTIRRAVEKRETQETLEKLRHRNELLLNAAGEGIFGLDLQGRHTFVNPAAASMLGYTIEELIGQDSHSIWHHSRSHGEPYPKNECPLHRGIPNQPIYGNDNEVFWHKNGTCFPVEYMSTPIQEAGQIAGVVVVFRDVTEREQRKQEIEQRNRELTGLLKLSQQLAGQHTLQKLLTTVTNISVNTLPTGEAVSLWLVNEPQNTLTLRAWAGHADKHIAGLTVPIDTSLVGWVFRSREPQTIPDITTEPMIEFSDALILKDARSTLGVPLLADNRPIGVLLANSFSQPQAFGPNDIRWLQSLAGQAAIMIQNEQLYEQVRGGRKRLEILSRQLLEVQETERRFLARELHDEIGQTLTMVKINLQMMQRAVDTGNPNPYLKKGINTVDHAIQHVRNLSLDLRPSLLDDLGLVPTLRWYVDRQAQETGIKMQFTATSVAKRPPPDLEIACFRLVQEALTNIIRHGQARHVKVALSQPDHELSLTIRDDGVGFDVQTVLERAAQGTGLGLLGMQERVQFAGGQIKINSTPNQGTEIQVHLPIPSPEPVHKTRKEG